jgi:serine/threonine protein kinase
MDAPIPLPVAIAGNYELIRPIGSGSFAVVWLARHRLTGAAVAIKVIHRSSIDSPDATTRFTREISILSQLNHPFIAELFEVLQEDDAYYLVMEYVEHGTILHYVNSHGPLPEERARRYFCQLMSALDYLHNTKFIAHRDLKAENVLLDRHDNIRLIDFGLSKGFTKGTPTLATACGSPAYAAPEMIKGGRYTKAADMWSAGILLYALVAGYLPFDDQNPHRIFEKVLQDEVRYPSRMSRALVELLSRLLTKDPNARITIDRLTEQPWFAQCPYAGLIGFDTAVFQGDAKLGVDRDILEWLGRHGFDCDRVIEDLRVGVYSDLTAVYRHLRRDKATNQIKSLLDGMNSFRYPTSRRQLRAPSPSVEPYHRNEPLVPPPAMGPIKRPTRSATPTPSFQGLQRQMARRQSIPIDCQDFPNS